MSVNPLLCANTPVTEAEARRNNSFIFKERRDYSYFVLNKTKNEGCPATFVFLYLYMFFRYFLGV